jgi:FemAB-related protein (PEP-CTERM system-associated)
MPDVAVKRLEPAGIDRWNGYVRARPEATFFHRAEWMTVLERALGHATFYLYAERRGEIAGILPLGQVRSWLFGNSLISTPFCVYGGVVADGAAEAAALTEAACDLARRLGVDYLELRNLCRRQAGWPCKELYVTFRREIDPDPQKNLEAIPRKQRAMVRKGMQQGLRSEIDSGIERFFPIYAESVRNLGTPVFPRRLFEGLREAFGDDCEILTVSGSDGPVSSVLSFYFEGREVLPYYGGGTAAARAVAGNDFLYWELMRRAAERGIRWFDFGRSKREAGSYRFKKHWGFEPQPLFYEYFLVRAREVPEINPLNPRYRLFVEAWKRLPGGVARRIGPWIARNLG